MQLEDGARRVARVLRDAGFEAYFAGGCVRDLLLGRPPKDFDIATDALPDQIGKLFRRTLFIGAAFGVVQVRLGGHGYEVATYRRDGDYVDGRRPEIVHYSSSKEEDVERRDFTINALLMDPETREVLDFVGGQDDLRAGRIRAVGHPDDRFREDRLRMLRAVRFATRFCFDIESETARAIREQAPALAEVSAERVLQELMGILESDHAAEGVRRLEALGLWRGALPFLPTDDDARARRYAAVDRAGLAEQPVAHRAALGFALLFGEATPAEVEAAMRDLKASKALIRGIRALAEARPLLEAPDEHRPADLIRWAVDADADRVIAYAQGLGLDQTAQRLRVARRDVEARPLPTRPVLTGADLAQAGLKPGPRFKELLAEADDLVLERGLASREDALAWLGRQIGEES